MISESLLTQNKSIKILGYIAYQSNPDNTAHARSIIIVKTSLFHSPVPETSETYLHNFK
jgi:hypothetical protein